MSVASTARPKRERERSANSRRGTLRSPNPWPRGGVAELRRTRGLSSIPLAARESPARSRTLGGQPPSQDGDRDARLNAIQVPALLRLGGCRGSTSAVAAPPLGMHDGLLYEPGEGFGGLKVRAKWAYRSVIRGDEWPRTYWTLRRRSPRRSISEAAVCRRSWKRMCGMPAGQKRRMCLRRRPVRGLAKIGPTSLPVSAPPWGRDSYCDSLPPRPQRAGGSGPRGRLRRHPRHGSGDRHGGLDVDASPAEHGVGNGRAGEGSTVLQRR